MKKINKMIAAGLLGLMTTSTCFMGCQNGFGYGDEDFQVTESRGILDEAATAIETFSNPASLGKKILSWGFGKFKEWAMGTSTAKKITSMFDITNFFNMIFGVEESEAAVTLKDLDGKLDEMMATLKDVKKGVEDANIKLDRLEANEVNRIINARVGTLLTLGSQLKIALGDLKLVEIDRDGTYEDPVVKEKMINEIITTFFNKVVDGSSMDVRISDLLEGLDRTNNAYDLKYFDILKKYAAIKYEKIEQQKNYVENLVLFDTSIVTQTIPLMIYHCQHFYESGASASAMGMFTSFMDQYKEAVDQFEFDYKAPEVKADEVAILADGNFYVFKGRVIKDFSVSPAEHMISHIKSSELFGRYKVTGDVQYNDPTLSVKFSNEWLAKFCYHRKADTGGWGPYDKVSDCGDIKNKILDDQFFKALGKEYPNRTVGQVLRSYFGSEVTDDYNIVTKNSSATLKWDDTWGHPDKESLKVKAWTMTQKCGTEKQDVGYGKKYLTLDLVKVIPQADLK